MTSYPVIRLGQTPRPLETTPPPSRILTDPRAVVDSQIAKIEDAVAEKLKDQAIKNMLIGGSFGVIAGLLLCRLGQSLMGYEVVKKSDLGRFGY